jgi:hypothetical protein
VAGEGTLQRVLGTGPFVFTSVLLVAACSGSTGPGGGQPQEVVVAAVGDIVCGADTDPTYACQHEATAALVHEIAPQAVLALGDIQYEEGELEDFQRFYEPTWGAFKATTYPAPGNHEYESPGARGYYDYFNGIGVDSGRAGHRARGYYAFTLGSWHAIALNSNCAAIGGCSEGSPQEQWLRGVLASSSATCTLAFWHHPLFSASRQEAAVATLWKALQEHRVDLVLTAHDHLYQRFSPLTWSGVVDSSRGIPSFVVGTGGKNVYDANGPAAGLDVKSGRTFGVLRLVLRAEGFDWKFLGVPGSVFSDSGAARCR